MKLVTYQKGKDHSLGVLLDETRVLDARAAYKILHSEDPRELHSMINLIEGGEEWNDKLRNLASDPVDGAILDLGDVRLLAPIPLPVQMRDCLVFEEHLKNSFEQMSKITGRNLAIPEVWYDQPIYYKSNRMSVIGPEMDVQWPSFSGAYSEFMDFELEMAVVLGKTGKDIKVEDAGGHIFGYTIYNDMTARDIQAKEMAGQLGPAKGKDFDTGNILGPCIVTPDEIGPDVALDMNVSVNGERWGGGNSSSMQHSFAEIISYISQSETLHAGEVIGSGTVGTGCGLELGRSLSDGDVIELTIEKIGTLRNRITKTGLNT